MSKASDELENAIRKAKIQSKLLAKTGRALTKKAQTITDLADASISLNRIAPDLPDVEHQISNWGNLGNSLGIARQAIGSKYLPMINSTAGTVTGSTSAAYSEEIVFRGLPEAKRREAKEAIEAVHRILFRDADEELLVQFMRNYGLDIPERGKKSPIELMTTGFGAFNAPVDENNPISTSLIPIREAIESSISRFLPQRRTQEEAKNWYTKIFSIGRQLRRDGISIETIESLAHQWSFMQDRYLSSAKTQDITRGEWRSRLKEVTLWFKSFLGGLDPQKLRF